MAGRVVEPRNEANARGYFRVILDKLQFFHVGNISAMRLPAALRPSANFSTRPGSVHHLYSVLLTINSALVKTAALAPFSVSP